MLVGLAEAYTKDQQSQKSWIYITGRIISRNDDCTTQAFTAVSLARSAGSSKTEDRIKILYNKLIQSSWGKEQSVIQLGQTLSINK